MRVNFHDLDIGVYFWCNGNLCRKQSKRTALLVTRDRVFYFNKKDVCQKYSIQGLS